MITIPNKSWQGTSFGVLKTGDTFRLFFPTAHALIKIREVSKTDGPRESGTSYYNAVELVGGKLAYINQHETVEVFNAELKFI